MRGAFGDVKKGVSVANQVFGRGKIIVRSEVKDFMRAISVTKMGKRGGTHWEKISVLFPNVSDLGNSTRVLSKGEILRGCV